MRTTFYELEQGGRLDRYEVGREIGRGSQGLVYEAYDPLLDRDVALKTIGTEAGIDARLVGLDEARLLARIDSPHVAALHDVLQLPQAVVLVMERVHGPTLTTLMRNPLSWTEVGTLGAQLARGLQALHDAGVVHGDIKPANLRLSLGGVLKILDFGIAGPIRRPLPSVLLEGATDVIVGTIPYMSPERLLGTNGDPRSDIYSAGVVLYELATGHRPFEDITAVSGIARILTTSYPSPRERSSSVPSWLDRVIVRAMSRDPAERFQSATELSRALVQEPDDDRAADRVEWQPDERLPRGGVAPTIEIPPFLVCV